LAGVKACGTIGQTVVFVGKLLIGATVLRWHTNDMCKCCTGLKQQKVIRFAQLIQASTEKRAGIAFTRGCVPPNFYFYIIIIAMLPNVSWGVKVVGRKGWLDNWPISLIMQLRFIYSTRYIIFIFINSIFLFSKNKGRSFQFKKCGAKKQMYGRRDDFALGRTYFCFERWLVSKGDI
jgi:hypothetical protein